MTRRWALCMLVLAATARGPAAPPLALHPENPRYFLFRGRPTVVVTSGEHYGALLNLDFDFHEYFEELERCGLNGTRVFSGAYVESAGSFRIEKNTLDPAPQRYVCPWARSDADGYADGGAKFDLTRWDDAYFSRLRDLLTEASARGVIVELNLFCPFYEDSQWLVSPMQAKNNVNGLGALARTDVYTLDKHGGLLAVQEAMTRRIAAAAADFDNVYLEIANEPYFGGVTTAWQHRIADVIVDAQRDRPEKLLISQNVANGSATITSPHPAVSIFNFHYATPPDAVGINYALGRVIGDNETGFRGTRDAPYRMEAWDFLIAGGGLFNHLDYSFTTEHPRGTWTAYPETQPGGGSPALRAQLGILARFFQRLDFVRMRPENSLISGGVPPGATARALVEPGKAYAIYLRGRSATSPYSARWTGSLVAASTGEHTFHTVSNDGVRFWLDDKLIIDNWTDHGETEDTARASLTSGRSYKLRLEYFYNGGQSVIRLRWTEPHRKAEAVPQKAVPPEAVPAACLRLPDGSGKGLRGEYFKDRDFEEPWRERVDANVDFAWGVEPPLPVAGATAGGTTLELNLPRGSFAADWIDPRSGAVVATSSFEHPGGARRLEAPSFAEDIALRILRR